ncbi:MAG TPA: TMEM175 family protein [Solirubrobacterales bacterium]|nr:TMEM175 family protein [Solirubrobacterales bacterium]
MSTARAEAFSDGVFAIAITLLVLEVHVPQPGSGSLAHELGAQWPSYAAYVISFMTIGIIWINHHVMFRRLRTIDHGILIWNLLLLMCVGALPFTTALMATYLKEGQGEILAAAIYSGSMLLMTLIFAATNYHVLVRKAGFLIDDVDEEIRHLTLRREISGALPYLLATALAVVSPYLTLAICAAVAIFYALPFARANKGSRSAIT